MRLFTKDEIDAAAELLRRGELVAFPTETVYGLGASLYREEALSKIYMVKGRPSDNPLIVHVAHLEKVEELATDIPSYFYLLAKAFCPGPLTFILKKKAHISSVVSGGLDSIAIRIPSHPLARALLSSLQAPIAAPSANLSGRPSSTEIAHILEDFKDAIGGAIDGGVSTYGLESTVINLLVTPLMILRPGVISQKEIEKVLGEPVAMASSSEKRLSSGISPGTKYRHYAPHAKIKLFFKKEELLEDVNRAPLKKRVILSSVPLTMATSKPLKGKTLYKEFRLADQENMDEILIFCNEKTRQDSALMNRLMHTQEEEKTPHLGCGVRICLL